MAMLDRRLKRMEEQLIKNVPKEEISAVLSTTGRSAVRPSISTTSARSGASARKRTAATAFGDELDIWARGDSSTTRNGMGMPETWEDSSLGRVGRTIDADDGSHALPPKDIQEHLAEVFFDYVYGQPYLLLHKPSFMRRLRYYPSLEWFSHVVESRCALLRVGLFNGFLQEWNCTAGTGSRCLCYIGSVL